MKKILALVLALTMILTAVSAFAAGSPSPVNPGGKGGGTTGGGGYTGYDTTAEEEVTMGKVADNDATKAIKQLFVDGNAAGDPLSKLPDDVKGKIAEGFKTVNEMVTYQLSGDVSKVNSLTLTFTFETKYADGEEVTVLIGIAGAKETEWIVKTGKGDKDGNVVVSVTKAELDKISSNPFVVIPVSK